MQAFAGVQREDSRQRRVGMNPSGNGGWVLECGCVSGVVSAGSLLSFGDNTQDG
jgi:hypothetical protein